MKRSAVAEKLNAVYVPPAGAQVWEVINRLIEATKASQADPNIKWSANIFFNFQGDGVLSGYIAEHGATDSDITFRAKFGNFEEELSK